MFGVDAHTHMHEQQDVETIDHAGIGLVCCGTSPCDWGNVQAFCDGHVTRLASYGVHPWFVHDVSWDTVGSLLAQHLADDSQACVGEIGLDYARRDLDRSRQQALFAAQLALASDWHRPVSIHCVRAWQDLLSALDRFPCRALIHAFHGSAETACTLAERGVYVSFRLPVKPPSAAWCRALCAVPATALLVETDAGQQGRPWSRARFQQTLVGLAKLRGEAYPAFAAQVVANAKAFFAPAFQSAGGGAGR